MKKKDLINFNIHFILKIWNIFNNGGEPSFTQQKLNIMLMVNVKSIPFKFGN